MSLGSPAATAPVAVPPYDIDPHWSPDGTWIAFDRDPGGAMVADAAGRHVFSLDGGTSSWSPDGRKIAFSRRGAITVAAPSGSDPVTVTSPPSRFYDIRPAWSPDGSTIAFERRPVTPGGYEAGSIWVVPAAGGEARKLDARTESEWNAAWSPDSSRIAFSSCAGAACEARRDGDSIRSDLFLERGDGTGLVRLTHTGDNDRPQ
jgi:Tol biopolymer transport system component